MLIPFLPLLAKFGLYLIDKFISDKKKQEEYRLAVLESLVRYNQCVLDSAKLRQEYDRLKEQLRNPPSAPTA